MGAEAYIGSELVRRATVEEIVAKRNACLSAYSEAHNAWLTVAGAVERACKLSRECGPAEANRFSAQIDRDAAHFHYGMNPPAHPDYMKTARKIVDVEVWARIIEMTDLRRLMDKTARDQFAQQLITDPPEVTVENVFATLQTAVGNAGLMFRRGIATCFSNLDRRFRSHDGWKIGSRVILTYAFNEFGSWNYHRDHEATMADIERVFRVLDEKLASHCEIVHLLNQDRRGLHGRRQSEVTSEYFTVRAYKNGNAHIWFKRDDLVEKVNQLLGEYYGAPIPEDREPDEDTGLHDPKTTLAKRYGFFPTPIAAADKLIEGAMLVRKADELALRVLEPSAGAGGLARRCARPSRDHYSPSSSRDYRFDPLVDCVEVQPALTAELRAEGIYRKVYTADFLQLAPATTGLYDRIVMNPPFDRERDIDHVIHALNFLKPDGFLTAIMSAGTEFRETKKSIAFRALMAGMKARWTDLPAGSFSSVGTHCNTIILRVWKDGRSFY